MLSSERPLRAGTRLERVLRAGLFAVTAELNPPDTADPQAVYDAALVLSEVADAINCTDASGANVHMSSLGMAALLARAGYEPVYQMSCRDRNRIALQGDLLGAAENPFAPPLDWRPERLAKKAQAGAEFIQTQYIYDVPVFGRFMARVRDLGLDERLYILAGVGPLRSPRAAEFMRGRVPGVVIPDAVVERLNKTPKARWAEVGMQICVEIIEQVRAMPGVAGVHVMAYRQEEMVAEIIRRAGLFPRVGEDVRRGA